MDPITQVKRMLVDVEAKLPAGAPKLSAMIPTPPAQPAPAPEAVLRAPVEVFKQIEEATGLPRLSAAPAQVLERPAVRIVGEATKMVGG
ncbi:MAG: hypothetical protein JRE40_06820 [Deltaproteobacteria bacterium]|nr:hypothetical protein [Deltaproteobacteria bacterium]MBW2672943.1 hypothetical protein [Deltaproteobacteria bacterium]